jgi:hypothetical protein
MPSNNSCRVQLDMAGVAFKQLLIFCGFELVNSIQHLKEL